jgi:hypothetical protein
MDANYFDGKIDSVEELLEEIRKAGFGLHHAHIRSWFRGHANWTWTLTPGVYRDNFNVKSEQERLEKERHLTQDFRAMSAGLLHAPLAEADLYFIQQHYRMPTRLLDWTTSPLAALHFAVESALNSDGALFMIDAYGLGPDQGAKWNDGKDFKGIASGRNPHFENALHPIFRWSDAGSFPKFIVPVRPDRLDRRIALQRGCFTFHPPNHDILTTSRTKSLKAYCIHADKKTKLRDQLASLGVDRFSIFGDLDNLADYLKYVHKIG